MVLSRPYLENSVRELSKVMDGATPGQVKELCQLLSFLNKTKDEGLRMRFTHEKPWEIDAFSNSDFTGD